MLTLYASSDVRDVKSNPRLAYCYMLVDDSGAVVAKMAENAPTDYGNKVDCVIAAVYFGLENALELNENCVTVKLFDYNIVNRLSGVLRTNKWNKKIIGLSDKFKHLEFEEIDESNKYARACEFACDYILGPTYVELYEDKETLLDKITYRKEHGIPEYSEIRSKKRVNNQRLKPLACTSTSPKSRVL